MRRVTQEWMIWSGIDPVGVAMPGARLPERIRRIVEGAADARISRVRASRSMATCALLGGMFIAGAIGSPQPQSAAVKFEVASIKPHNNGGPKVWHFLPGGTFADTGLPLQRVITIAYDIPFPDTQLSGGPDWIRSDDDGYDIEAKAPEDAVKGLSMVEFDDRMRLMLQALLADRFKLTVRREPREQPVYILTVAKNGSKLRKSTIERQSCDVSGQCNFEGAVGQGRGIHVRGFTIANLVSSLDNFTDRPLLDQTGLTGLYDIDTDGWVPMRGVPRSMNINEAAALADPNRPTLSMIFDELGLKMTRSEASVESFEIEHIERPVAN